MTTSPPSPLQPPTVRPIVAEDAAQVREDLLANWGSTQIWSLGRRYDADRLEGFVAEIDGRHAGSLTLALHDGAWQCEVITLASRVERRGVGAALLVAAENRARSLGCKRIFLTTTNDNVHAMRFYQRRGWRFSALHAGIVDRVRRYVPTYPLVGLEGIEIHDEIEVERWVG
ncbi:MAG: GNAT family N-acetyltransferase [Phycisphaerae bacterium]|nr:GNAT family N-acetyltransferase [Phycisphaerae bacterium]